MASRGEQAVTKPRLGLGKSAADLSIVKRLGGFAVAATLQHGTASQVVTQRC